MQKKDIFRFGLLAAALALSQGAWALGLGKLTVQSALGQPLKAQVELMGTKEEFSELAAKIAAPSLYQDKDLVYQAALTRTKVTIEYRADGSAFLKIISSQPVTEPYIDLLVEATWPTGHALRGYTVLLDPPTAGQPEPIIPSQQATVGGRTRAREAAAATATTTTTTAPATAASATPSTQQGRPQAAPTRTGTGTSSAAGGDYTVQRGDTLSGIAKTYKTDEITLNQALAALYEANPSAFIGKNMNRLRSGAILQVPSQEEMAAVSKREANHVVHVQVAEWRSYLEQVASQPTSVRPKAGSTTAEGTITPTPTVVEGAGKGKDQLVVSTGSGQQGGRGKASGSAATGKSAAESEAAKNAAAEEKAALQKTIDEEKSRVKELEDIVKKQQKALDIQNEKLAQLQKQAEESSKRLRESAAKPQTESPKPIETSAQPGASTVKPPESPAAKPSEAPVAKPPESPVEPPKLPDTQQTTTPPPAGGDTTATTEPPVKPPVKRVPPPPPPPPERGLFDIVVEAVSENLLLAGGIIVAVLGGIVLLAYRRRRAEEVAVDSLFGATTTSATTTTGTMSPHSSLSSVGDGSAHGTSTTASSNSILSEFSREGLGSIDTGEVDPLAEADVYLAYGRAQQAEEILQDALKREPSRQDFFLKLLEVYADQKKTTEFETTAKQLHSLTQGQGEFWQRAAVIGQRLLPGNALFADGGAMDSGFSQTNVATEPLQIGGQKVDPRGFAPIESKSIAERAADIANRAVEARGASTQPPAKDFTFSSGSASASNDFGVDLDLEELSRFKNYGKAEERVDITSKPRQPDIEFNLDEFDTPPQIDAEKEEEFRAPSLDELDFSDNDSIAEDPSPSILEGQWHDAATKLDLARAYQATGDAEACREILQEVLHEGDDQQKAEANAILQNLS